MLLTTDYSLDFFNALAQAGYENRWRTNHNESHIIFGSNAYTYGTAPFQQWQYIKPEDAIGFLILPTRESKIEYLTSIGIRLTEGERNTL